MPFYVIRRSVQYGSAVVLSEHASWESAARSAKVQRGTQSHIWSVETFIPADAENHIATFARQNDIAGHADGTYLIPERDSLAYYLSNTDDRAGWTETTKVF